MLDDPEHVWELISGEMYCNLHDEPACTCECPNRDWWHAVYGNLPYGMTIKELKEKERYTR